MNNFVLDWVEGPITEEIVLIHTELDPIGQGFKVVSVFSLMVLVLPLRLYVPSCVEGTFTLL
jgi:hypothetical protein